MTILAWEPGSLNLLESLGGMKSRIGRGRSIEQYVITPGDSVVLLALPANSNRVAAIIQNVPLPKCASPHVCEVWFGDQYNLWNGIYLDPGQTLQIDKDFPWTGGIGVRCAEAGQSCQVNAIELSV